VEISKYRKIVKQLGLCPGPTGELTALPIPKSPCQWQRAGCPFPRIPPHYRPFTPQRAKPSWPPYSFSTTPTLAITGLDYTKHSQNLKFPEPISAGCVQKCWERWH